MASSGKDSAALLQDFLGFLNASWTAYHATAEARRRLLEAGFEQLDESQTTHLVKASFFFVDLSCYYYYFAYSFVVLVVFFVGVFLVQGGIK